MNNEIDWPVECDGCGTVHESPESNEVRSVKESRNNSKDARAYVCLNCIDTGLLPDSNVVKNILSRIGSRDSSEGFLGREEI